MAAHHGHAHGGSGDFDVVAAQDLAGLFDQLHFLFGVAVLLEHIAVRQAVAVDGVGVGLVARYAVALVFHLLDGFDAGSGDGLVGADHHAFGGVGIVQRLEREYHLDGAAVGVGDDFVLSSELAGVDLRHNKFVVRRHAPRRAVVDDSGTGCGVLGGKLQASVAACAEQSHVCFGCDAVIHRHHRPVFALEVDRFAHRTGRGHRDQFGDWEVALLEHLEHFGAHQSGGTHDSYAHGCSDFERQRYAQTHVLLSALSWNTGPLPRHLPPRKSG